MNFQPAKLPRLVIHATLIAACAAIVAPTGAWAQTDVWVDPGHGGGDNGNPGFDGVATHQEKFVCLLQSQSLSSRLAQIGYTSLLTRNSDNNYPTLAQRALMAIGQQANDLQEQEVGQMFVSIHMNAPKVATNAAPFGTETYYSPVKVFAHRLDTYKVDSTFAAVIHANLMTGAAAAFLGCNRDRGVKFARHVVTREARVPAVLIEVCFLTNQCQQTNILQAGDRALISNGIAAGISNVIVPGGVPAYRLEPTTAEVATVATAAPFLSVAPPAARPANAGGTLSLSEGFEGATFPPNGWTQMTAGLPIPHRWHRAGAGLYVHAGSGAAFVGADSPGAIDEWLISPAIALGANDRGLRFFWNGNRNLASAVNAECLVRQVGAPSWTTVWSLFSESPASVFTYRERVVDLTSWIGNSVEVAFRVAGTNGADFMIDDVEVDDFSPTTAPANDVCANAATLPVGTFALSANTCNAANDADLFDLGPGCGLERFAGGDVFYRFDALADDTLEVNVVGSWFPAAYVMNACDTTIATCVATSPAIQTAEGDTAYVRHVFASAGTYYLVIDGASGDCGSFELLGRFRGPVTGVDDPPRAVPRLSLMASPNPSRGHVQLTAQAIDTPTGVGQLRIYDPSGRRVYEHPIMFVGGRGNIAWDGGDDRGRPVPTGVYTVEVRIGGERTGTQVVLTR